jgi:putative flippase GtrA
MPLQTFKYAACGGGNVLWGIFLYAFAIHFIFPKPVINIGKIPLYGHLALKQVIAADYLFAWWISFATGFYLNRYVVFTGSDLKKHVQFFRYGLIVFVNIILNYYLLLLFNQELHWYPIPSKIVSTVVTIIFSYFSQKYFSFKEEKWELDETL